MSLPVNHVIATPMSSNKPNNRRISTLPVAGKADCINFNAMVVGETGLGKSTFLRTLLKADDAKVALNSFTGELVKTVQIQEAGNFLLESVSGDVKFILYDTPGYGDFIDNHNTITQIREDLESRHARWLSVDAHKITNAQRLSQDERIHCCFYFIGSHRFKSIDREFIMQICDIVPIVPVIAKSDQMTVEERAIFLNEVNQELHQIASSKGVKVTELIYDFKEDDQFSLSVSPATSKTPSKADKEKIGSELKRSESNSSNTVSGNSIGDLKITTSSSGSRKLPCIANIFAVVCDTRYERSYPWGTCEVINEEHSDFNRLQSLIFEAGMHIKGFRDMTQAKTIDFLAAKDAFIENKRKKEELAAQEEEAKRAEANRITDLEAKLRAADQTKLELEAKLKLQAEEATKAAAGADALLRAEKEAKLAAAAEAKSRAEEARKSAELQNKLKEDLANANKEISKLRQEKDDLKRKSDAPAASVAPPVPPPAPAPAAAPSASSGGSSLFSKKR